jgi:hypothetical protein
MKPLSVAILVRQAARRLGGVVLVDCEEGGGLETMVRWARVRL